ncbi:MAG: purine NTP phosphatase, partial [Saccharolobus sp.]
AVGLLTKVIDRKMLYVQPIIMALYPLYNKID